MTLLMNAPTVPPEGALLVRLRVQGRADLAVLPPVPAPHHVTVSLGAPRQRALLPVDFADRGYRVVGTHDAVGPAAGDALLLVRAALLDAQPAWAQTLLARAQGIFACDLGPVQLVFRDQLAQHLHGQD